MSRTSIPEEEHSNTPSKKATWFRRGAFFEVFQVKKSTEPSYTAQHLNCLESTANNKLTFFIARPCLRLLDGEIETGRRLRSLLVFLAELFILLSLLSPVPCRASQGESGFRRAFRRCTPMSNANDPTSGDTSNIYAAYRFLGLYKLF